MHRFLFALLIGLGGAAILVSLGFWQLRRLDEKQAYLADLTARLEAPAEALPAAPDPQRDRYRAVLLDGATTGQDLRVLSGIKGQGAVYMLISAFETGDGRRILLDRGDLPEALRDAPRPATPLILEGNLHWPQEADSYTPPPDPKTGVWFARDVPAMAQALGTEPVLVVARSVSGDTQGATPRPLTVEGVPNNHLGYAVQWFLMAAVWLGMTGLYAWRIRRGPQKQV